MGPRLSRGTRVVALASLALLLLAAAADRRAVAVELPPEAARLLPADAVAILVFRSLDEAEREWAGLAALGIDSSSQGRQDQKDEQAKKAETGRKAKASKRGRHAAKDEPEVARPEAQEARKPPQTPRDLVAKLAPGLASYVDGGRPIAIAAVLPPPMSPTGPSVAIVLPMREGATDPYFVRSVSGNGRAAVQGGYAAVSSDTAYAPGGEAPALVAGLPEGIVVARADLERVITMYRPLVEMGLAAMAQPGAFAPADSGAAPKPQMDPEQLAATRDFLRGLCDSARRLDLAVDHAAAAHRLSGTLAVTPGSMFDPGSQPDFAPALALARFIPDEFAVLEAFAFDPGPAMDRFVPIYRGLMADQARWLPPDAREAYLQWLADTLEMTKIWHFPVALGVTAGPRGTRVQAVASVAEPDSVIERTVEHYKRINGMDVGIALSEGPEERVDGVRVRTFALKVDAEKFARMSAAAAASAAPDSAGPAAPAAPDTAAARMFAGFMGKFWPAIRVAAPPGHIVVCADGDPAAMPALLARVRAGSGEVPPALQSAAASGGLGTQFAVCGDLGGLLLDLMAAMDTTLARPAETRPVPFVATSGVRGSELDFAVEGDLGALAELFQKMESLMSPKGEKEQDAAPAAKARLRRRD